MFASIVTRDCCQLFCVDRTNLITWDRKRMECAPGDWDTISARAREYQRTVDPQRERYDYRIGMCS